MKAEKIEPKDKVYKLKNNAMPLSYVLASRNTKSFPLMYFDESKNQNRALRYASNQKSCFEDEQDGNAIIEPVIFENGFLSVPRTNPVLQQFMFYHPLKNNVFVEVDKEMDAGKDVEKYNREADALIEARKLTIDMLENVYRILFSKDPTLVSTNELRRDIFIQAKKDPVGFMNVINDPDLHLQANVHLFFDNKLLVLKNQERDVFFNTNSTKKKMLSLNYGDDPYSVVATYLKTDEGVDILKLLESSLLG